MVGGVTKEFSISIIEKFVTDDVEEAMLKNLKTVSKASGAIGVLTQLIVDLNDINNKNVSPSIKEFAKLLVYSMTALSIASLGINYFIFAGPYGLVASIGLMVFVTMAINFLKIMLLDFIYAINIASRRKYTC